LQNVAFVSIFISEENIITYCNISTLSVVIVNRKDAELIKF